MGDNVVDVGEKPGVDPAEVREVWGVVKKLVKLAKLGVKLTPTDKDDKVLAAVEGFMAKLDPYLEDEDIDETIAGVIGALIGVFKKDGLSGVLKAVAKGLVS